MKILISATLDNLPESISLVLVEDQVRRQLGEWLDMDQHPSDMKVVVRKITPIVYSDGDD